MKNKESKTNMLKSSNLSKKEFNKIDAQEAARLITNSARHKTITNSQVKNNRTGPSKTQIDRLKKFYNTTRWLPNSAFTTYFGKPAFENYGNGNTKPTYGGLFYGNYMLSHNVNPMDGQNIPETKQVYSSAMLKSIKKNETRRPSPPRKTPDGIRNTADELEEIKGRNPIFQLPNHFPARDIIKPNLIKARIFRSGKNSPNESINNLNEHEVFEIEDVINNRFPKKKKKTYGSKVSADFNPFDQCKTKIPKKKTKEELNMYDNNNNNYNNYSKNEEVSKNEEIINNNFMSNNNANYVNKQNIEEDEYLMKKQFYDKMLNEDNKEMDIPNVIMKQNLIKMPTVLNIDDHDGEDLDYEIQNEKNLYENKQRGCECCQSAINIDSKNRLKRKENPALIEPQEINQTYICCVHNYSKERISIQDKDPRNYRDKPACLLNKVGAAGKSMKKSEPIGNLFR